MLASVRRTKPPITWETKGSPLPPREAPTLTAAPPRRSSCRSGPTVLLSPVLFGPIFVPTKTGTLDSPEEPEWRREPATSTNAQRP
jgi:hypothetical protein